MSSSFRFALRNNDFKAGTLLILGNLKLALASLAPFMHRMFVRFNFLSYFRDLINHVL